MLKYLFLAATICLTLYGQLIIKSRSLRHANVDAAAPQSYLFSMFFDPWVMSGLFAAVLASATWILALRQANLSFLYPFMAINFALVPVLSALLLGEVMSVRQIVGIAVVVVGLLVMAA